MISEVYNEDCMALMSRYPDKYFDLAVVDPPYGILNKTKRGSQRSPHKYKVRAENWDFPPNEKYFNELFRVSKNQIICGGNYFLLPLTQGWIFWYKHQPVDNYSKGELFWTSFDKPLQCFDFMYYGNINSDKNRFHPTQKPIALYDWIFKNYAKQGDKILDTHLGSGSSRIAAHKAGLDFIGCELDPDYFVAAQKRYKDFAAQLRIF